MQYGFTKIQNGEALALSPMRREALEIAEAGLQAIDTKEVIARTVQATSDMLYIQNHKIPLTIGARIFVVGIGKCSLDAAIAFEALLGDHIAMGIVVDVRRDEGALTRIKSYQGDHPFPTQRNVDATHAIIELLTGLAAEDVVIMIISGGGSTLLCQPHNFTCQEESSVVECLFKAGATIQEINTVRKHLSLARGGNLAKYAYPARVISLIFSDVPGDDLEFIASGPTVKDSTTTADAQRIIEKYRVWERCGFSLGELVETPKEDTFFAKVTNLVVAGNTVALTAMAEHAKTLGYIPLVCTACLTGEAEEVGRNITQELHAAAAPMALLFGGETTVTVKGEGQGGRNQELSLSALRFVQNNELVLALASDGRDNSEAAGAICDTITLKKATRMGLMMDEYLARSDSFSFFVKTHDQVVTGPTGSNVADLTLALKRS
ncbi:MAG: DUF4147 domain-containing protein [Parcubacteria group bacterium]|nr:DUF4147 domain-containing protein [Parcubacteria group bacterium]